MASDSINQPGSRKFHHPYEPYDIQLDLMQTIYECIEEGKIGILESPTGTGKSLSLICSSLTWLRDFQGRDLQQQYIPASSSDEPQWVIEYDTEAKRRDAFERMTAMEDRLKAVRARELRQKAEYEKGEPAPKRVKRDIKDDLSGLPDEVLFDLEDYSSGDESPSSTKYPLMTANEGISTENIELLQKLGLAGHTDVDNSKISSTEVKVFFCSRTHSQLAQFAHELRRVTLPGPPGYTLESDGAVTETDNHIEVKHLPLGSRKNLCINPKVSSLGSVQAINERCLELQQPSTFKDHKCPFIPNADNETLVHQFRDHTLAKIRDIEDLGFLGEKLGVCPYYASRAAVEPSEIITLPYPLLLQETAREALGLSLKNQVVLIDEAHNLMDTIANLHSTCVTRSQLSRCREQITIYLEKFRHRLKGKNRTYIAQVVRLIDSLSNYLDEQCVKKQTGDGVVSVAALMAGKGADQINLHKLVKYLQESRLARKVEGYVKHTKQDQEQQGALDRKSEQRFSNSELPVLSHFQSFMQTLANPAAEGRFFYERDDKEEVMLKYALLDPTFHFKAVVEEARAVILTGGTMSPMDDYTQHLFAYVEPERIKTFSCRHIIPKENLQVHVLETGEDGVALDFTFAKRNSSHVIQSLGKTLLKISGQIPDGLVVFFPSYAYLDCVLSEWKAGNVWARLEKTKPIFQEPKGTATVDHVLVSYSEAIANGLGGLLLSVIGGKLSEGINFSDSLGRGVVVVGLPFPNIHTAQWRAKLQYVEKHAKERTGRADRGKAAAKSFVENVCMRAVNQSIGRAIRHRGDYASILLLDKRYSSEQIQGKLPVWIRQSVKTGGRGNSSEVVDDLRHFFETRSR